MSNANQQRDQAQHILQNGCAKSGNYWLYTLLQHVLDEAHVPRRSYIQAHPISAIAERWRLSHPDQAGTDVIDIEPGRYFTRIGPYFREPIADLDEYIEQTRLIWTHSPYCSDSRSVYHKVDRVVYIIRDPRDVAISMSHFMFTPYMQERRRICEQNPKQYLERNFIRHVTGWVNHVATHLAALPLPNFYVVFYERLKSDFEQELGDLLSFLGYELSKDQKERISNNVTVDAMQSRAGRDHVRSGVSGGWRNVLSPGQVRTARHIAGPLLASLNYPLAKKDQRLPRLPDSIERRSVRTSLRRAMLVRGCDFVARNIGQLRHSRGN